IDHLLGTEDDFIPVVNQMTACNVPNPFNPETEIQFYLPEAGTISLDVYNIRGQHITRLAQGYRTQGNHSAIWNGKDKKNTSVGSGVYFYRISNGDNSIIRKMMLLK
ncbi:MAG: T9SS type A sorting domain-containing protein, partial [Candidatus Cloacimonetes bacterium]|nr:T9SS type A sorting domain-containing protein [Candidatus Cloacimonadota bacterium]